MNDLEGSESISDPTILWHLATILRADSTNLVVCDLWSVEAEVNSNENGQALSKNVYNLFRKSNFQI